MRKLGIHGAAAGAPGQRSYGQQPGGDNK